MEHLQRCSAAAFSAALDDFDPGSSAPFGGRLQLRMSSDACTDAERVPTATVAPAPFTDDSAGLPHVCGMAEGQLWSFPLDTEWLRRHITLLESMGPFGNFLVFGPMYPEAELISEVDATAAYTAKTTPCSAPLPP